MQARPDRPISDARRRPLIITPLSVPVDDAVALTASLKESVGRGVDLVAVAASRVSPVLLDVLARVGVGWVATVASSAELASSAGIVTAATRPAAFLFSDSVDPGADRPGKGTGGSVPVIARKRNALRPGDGSIVPAGSWAELEARPVGTLGFVDLSDVRDRAACAAVVTVALDHGADGFVTTVPTAVRRAIHVIRAVEFAE